MSTDGGPGNDVVPIALDGMGGDFAPVETVAGAVDAARQGRVAVALVGDPDALKSELASHEGAERLPITVVPSEGLVTEGEPPVMAFRAKPRASIFVATGLVKEGHAEAVVSMGSSGATIAAATMMLGTYDGIERPCLGGPIIGMAPKTVLIDVGTNVDCRPQQLADFAALGAAMSRMLHKVENPRVAMLSIGAEEGKGNRLIKETADVLRKTSLNFIGNVEASDLPFGRAEVVVVDGFTGNVVMKLTEALGEVISGIVKRTLDGKLDPDEIEELSSHIYELTNPVEAYGGGPLFGVKGVAVVGHGKARAPAVSNAIRIARESVTRRFVEEGERALADVRSVAKS